MIANSGDVYIAENIGKIESVKNYGAGNTDNLNNLEEIIKKSVNCKGDLVANTGDVIKSKIIGDITSTRHYHSDDINLDERFERLNKILENADGIQGDIIANNGDSIKADTIGLLNLTSTFFSSGSTFTSRHDKNKIKTPGNPANKDIARSAGANSTQGSSNNAGVRPGPSTGTTNVFGGESSFIRTEKVTGTISSCENINGLKSHDVHRVPRTGIIMSSKGTVETYNHGKPV
ncbi:hypothetical protein ACL2XO_24700 [Sodalis sp. RH15]|uniref:hypothetical protein n=1 Tax=Sodalis sp. RH15 TaxID=3394330 RepID=UPI0039B37653